MPFSIRHKKSVSPCCAWLCCKYAAESLNDHLYTGSHILNSLSGVFFCFRQEKVEIVSDVEAMYHLLMVFLEEQRFLRFLCLKDGENTTPTAPTAWMFKCLVPDQEDITKIGHVAAVQRSYNTEVIEGALRFLCLWLYHVTLRRRCQKSYSLVLST